MPMRGIVRRIRMLVLLGACAAAARAQGPIQMAAEPVFAGAFASGVTPIVVTLQNTGPSVEGAVKVSSGAFGMGSSRVYVYPLSLPTGSMKSVTVYPRVSDFSSSVRVTFDGSFRGVKPQKDVALNPGEAVQVGLIGDQAGGMGALRSLPSNAGTNVPMPGASTIRDVYATPETAPDRASGYATLRALTLANGAERMNPAQWEAIRRWVMAGGTLICTGGAGAVYLQTPGAAALSPVRNVHGATVNALALPNAKDLPSGPYALMTGAPAPGAAVLARQGGHVTLATRRLGAGAVVFTAFSPFEAPLRGWKGAAGLWNVLLETGRPAAAWNTLRQISLYGGNESPARAMPGRPIARGVNPFRIQLPPVSTVAALFALYFVLAVPVTYFVLKKMRRLEWAWVTNPVLAGAFAFVFYLFAASLYEAGMSRRTGGVLVSAVGTKDALLLGSTQVFFPRGGNHPIMIPNAETLEISAEQAGAFPMTRRSPETLTTVDVGVVSAPVFPVTNLAFRNIYYVQPVELSGGVTATLRRAPGGGLTGTVYNGAGRELRNAAVVAPGLGRLAVLGDLKPGQTARISETHPISETRQVMVPGPVRPGQSRPSRRPELRRTRSAEAADLARGFPLAAQIFMGVETGRPVAGALLVGRMNGEAFGPQMGRYVPGSLVDVLVSLPVEGGA